MSPPCNRRELLLLALGAAASAAAAGAAVSPARGEPIPPALDRRQKTARGVLLTSSSDLALRQVAPRWIGPREETR